MSQIRSALAASTSSQLGQAAAQLERVLLQPPSPSYPPSGMAPELGGEEASQAREAPPRPRESPPQSFTPAPLAVAAPVFPAARSGASGLETDAVSYHAHRHLRAVAALALACRQAPAAGATSIVAVLAGNTLYVANAGDSRCVLCRAGGVAEAMSRDHKPSDPTASKAPSPLPTSPNQSRAAPSGSPGQPGQPE